MGTNAFLVCSETQSHPFELGDLIKKDMAGEVDDVERLIDSEVLPPPCFRDPLFRLWHSQHGGM
jgi:hypothetical protein